MPSLILSSETARLSLSSERAVVVRRLPAGSNPRFETLQIRLLDVDRVIVIGKPAISIPALTHLMDRGIPCAFITSHGRWRGSLTPGEDLNAARRLRQYSMASVPAHSLRASKALIAAKLHNCRRVLQRLAANRGPSQPTALPRAIPALSSAEAELRSADTLDTLRGIEGSAASAYFKQLGSSFPPSFPFPARSRRPPRDPANATLSFGYTLLASEMECAIRSHGLDAAIGFFHTPDPRGRPSLALDLMEPFRAPVVDILAVSLASHGRLNPERDFISEPGGGFLFTEDGRKIFLQAYEQAMEREFASPSGTRTTLRRELDAQVCAYLRILEQDAGGPFFLLG